MTPPADPAEKIEFASEGPGGVGIADRAGVALNSIVVFSDPEGVGVDFVGLNRARREQLAATYSDGVRERFPGASAAQIVTLRSHLGLRLELPRVVMPDRPVRHGRHYLVFDQEATASVDCLWTDAEAARMASACDAVAGQLERVPSAR